MSTTNGAEAQSFQARSLQNSLTVKDLDKSTHWYSEVVGFKIDNKYEREGKVVAVVLTAGDVRLLLNQDNGARGWDRVKGEGFSLMFTTGQDVDQIAKRIKAKGGTLETEPADMPWGARSFRLLDPDGYKIAISSERRAAT